MTTSTITPPAPAAPRARRRNEAPEADVVLREHPFFDGMADEHVEKFLALGSEVVVEGGEIIFREGDRRRAFHLILSGHVVIEVWAPTGTLIMHTLHGGHELGWSALSPYGRQFQARAIDRVTLWRFPSERIVDACEKDHDFGYAVMKRVFQMVANRLDNTLVRLLDVYGPAPRSA